MAVIRKENGVYLVNGVEHMSVWAYRKKNSTPNIASNGIVSSALGRISPFVTVPTEGDTPWTKVRAFPVTVLNSYFSH